MALPPGVPIKTVTFGIASFFDGTLAEGTVTITAPANVIHTPTNRPIFSSSMSQRFVDGVATFNLAPTDAAGFNRRDFSYKANIVVTGALVQPDPIYFLLPESGPDTVDLDGLVTVPSSAGVPISVDVLTTEDLPVAITAAIASAYDTDVERETLIPARLSDVALRAALVPFWTASEVVTAGKVRMAPDGHVIQRIADGTARPTYDVTEQALWNVVGGGGAAGALLAANNLSDVALTATARANLGLGSAATQPTSAFDPAGAAATAQTAAQSYAAGAAAGMALVFGA